MLCLIDSPLAQMLPKTAPKQGLSDGGPSARGNLRAMDVESPMDSEPSMAVPSSHTSPMGVSMALSQVSMPAPVGDEALGAGDETIAT